MRVVVNLLMAAFFCPLFLASCLPGPESDSEDEKKEEVESGEEQEDDSEDEKEQAATPKPEKKKSLTELRKEKKELEAKLKELEALSGSQGSLIEREVAVSADLEKLRNYAGMLESHSADLDQSLQSWKAATRNSFVGVELPEIATSDGRSFQKVTIKRVEDETLTFEHEGGSETLEILSLPLDLRKNLIHEPTVLATRNQ